MRAAKAALFGHTAAPSLIDGQPAVRTVERMDAFGIEDGPCGAGSGRYAGGLFSLPDGIAYGIEAVIRIEVHGRAEGIARAGAVAGSFREALASPKAAPLPLRLALSTMRAGLSVVEEGLRPRDGLRVEIAFEDGFVIQTLMPVEMLATIRRDVEVARGILERTEAAIPGSAAPPLLPPPRTVPSDAPDDEALTSIFRYEKRNGRLRRVAASDKGEG